MAWGNSRKRAKVVETKPAYRGTKKDGGRKQIGTKCKMDDGTVRVLLNPSGKGEKYAQELHKGVHMTNAGQVKADKNGVAKRITDTEASYRSGYLQAQKDQARAYTASVRKNGKK